MTTDLEADLRRQFDAATPPTGSLTFSAESVLQQGHRTIRRRRIVAAGSAAFAVALIATGASLLTQPHDKALPQPATHTATSGIARAQVTFSWGHSDVEFNLDGRLEKNVRLFATTNSGTRLELGRFAVGKPGEKPDAIWRSGVVSGHPVTIGLIPGSDVPTITFAAGRSYAMGVEQLEGTGYTMFFVDYTPNASQKEPSAPAEIASIRWSASNWIVDGIEGDHRLTGRVLSLGQGVSVEVVLGLSVGGRTTVFGATRSHNSGNAAGSVLTATTTDPSGVAVVTGDQQLFSSTKEGSAATLGAPTAAGILPPGASGISWILSTGTGTGTSPVVVSDRMPDGTVIFAIKVQAGLESELRNANVKTVTWTNADGSQGRKDVIQQRG